MSTMYHELSAELLGHEAIRNYISGGKGIVTLQSPTGVHHTYKFSKPKLPDNFSEDTRFVYHLEKDKSWTYVGMNSSNSFRTTQRSKFPRNSPEFKGASYIIKMANTPHLQTKMRLFHEGVCGVCGRRLTTPESIMYGIGPKCRKKVLS